jgi:regulator of cell morphogenesis and NO signaling
MNIKPDPLRIQSDQRDLNSEYIDNLPVGELCNYIVKRHHTYVRENIPILKRNLEKICQECGEQHQEFFEIKELFIGFTRDFSMHIQKEEVMLFPFIQGLESAKKDDSPLPKSPFRSISDPIIMMMAEHQNEGQKFNKVCELYENVRITGNSCTTYEVILKQLKDFGNDLHMHIRLENNILFPKAFELIKE